MNFLRINLKVSATALFLIGLFGCSIQETKPSILATEGVNLELVQEVEAISEYQVQKIAFTQMLSKDEKTYFFKKRIAGKIQELSLTTAQRDHLDLLLANLTPELYATGSTENQKTVQFLSQWTKKGKDLFEQGTLYDIVGSLENSKGGSSTNKTAPPSAAKCGCSTSSTYCQEGYDCTYIPSCNIPGCGTLFAYTCNGSCDRVL